MTISKAFQAFQALHTNDHDWRSLESFYQDVHAVKHVAVDFENKQYQLLMDTTWINMPLPAWACEYYQLEELGRQEHGSVLGDYIDTTSVQRMLEHGCFAGPDGAGEGVSIELEIDTDGQYWYSAEDEGGRSQVSFEQAIAYINLHDLEWYSNTGSSIRF